MPAGQVLVASGVGDDPPGGVYAFEGPEPTILDNSDTTGLAVSPEGTRLARLLFTDDDPQTCGELFVYDTRGVTTYRRIDALQEPHSLAWHGDRLIAVSTLSNTVLWLDERGDVVDRRFMGGDGGDAWHVNNLLLHDGRVLASAFGRFDTHRGWAAPGARSGAGIVFDVATGADVFTGLTCPHDPLFLDGRWLVCDSGTASLWRMGDDGRPVERIDLGGWTRGITYDDAHVYVGVSAHRLLERTGRAEVVVLDRATLREERRIRMPCREVFALVWVTPELLEGLRAGFAVTALHRPQGDRTDVFATAARAPLPVPAADELDIGLFVAGMPARIAPGQPMTLRFHLDNRGRTGLASLGSKPLLVGARWFGADGAPLPAENRARLPHAVGPRGRVEGRLRTMAPARPGSYRLRVALLQEHVRWFDDGSTHAVWDAFVTVAPDAGYW